MTPLGGFGWTRPKSLLQYCGRPLEAGGPECQPPRTASFPGQGVWPRRGGFHFGFELFFLPHHLADTGCLQATTPLSFGTFGAAIWGS